MALGGFKAEGGPVVRPSQGISRTGASSVVGDPGIRPAGGDSSQSFHRLLYLSCQRRRQPLRPEPQPDSTLKLTVLWAAPAALTRSNHAVPLCALAPEFVLKLQTLPPH